MEIPIKMDDLGVPLFSETSISFHDKLTKLNLWDTEFRDWSGFAWYIIGGMGGPGGAGGA